MSPLSLPLLFLLHGLYLIYASLPLNPFRRSTQPSSSSGKAQRAPPRHVALLLVSPRDGRSGQEESSEGAARSDVDEGDVREAMLASIERVVEWAEEEGVEEVTIFEGRHNPHRLESLHSPLLSLLTRTPPSPPHSTPSSPPSPTSSWTILDETTADQTRPARKGQGSFPTTGAASSKGLFRNGMASLSVWSQAAKAESTSDRTADGRLRKRRQASRSSPHSSVRSHRPITLNLLLPSTSFTLLSNITRDLASSGTSPDKIDVNLIQSLVDESLPFRTTTEPELLLIHHLQPSQTRSPTFLSDIVHRITASSGEPEPVELHGFPPWLLRLTEIYEPPTPTPPLFSPPRSRSGPVARVIERDAWEGGMCAWEGVEQRFGR